MAAKAKYPLKQVLEIKQKRVEDAEKVVKDKQMILDQENEKLAQREADRDKVKKHKEDKLQQLRDTLDHGTTSPKVQQMKAYMKVVDEKLKVEEKKVKDQKDKVEVAKRDLEEAKHQLFLRRQEVDKLETHRKDWEKEVRKEEEIVEGREMDELGQVIYTSMKSRNQNSK
jgi:flagellar export protein FliJ